MMNSKIKEAWVNALRSGKYEQGESKLYSGQGYCCLGVLCDLYAKEYRRHWKFVSPEDEDLTEDEVPPSRLQKFDYFYFDGESEFLPETVMEWAELDSNNPEVKIDVEDEEEDPRYYTDQIANVNDSGYTFSQIADLIQAQL